MKTKLALLSAAAVSAAALFVIPQFVAAQAPAAPAAAGIPETPRDPNAFPRIQGQNVNGMHVYLRAGLKTHNEGEHDYPQFLADFSKVLTAHGAVVDGSYHFPTAEELKGVDVIVMYKGDTGYMTPVEKANLEAFVKRGGGIVGLHDFMCGPDPDYYAGIVGGAKKHGQVNFTLMSKVAYTVVDKASPLMKGVSDGDLIMDESFYAMTWAKSPEIHVLATTVIDDTPSARNGFGGSAVGKVVPQIWTYEHTQAGGTAPARSFVWMQGHSYANIMKPEYTNMLLRGIAWAGKQPIDSLVDYKAPPPPARAPRPAAH
jgi:type 1 glutamine amidotransferase